MTPPLERGFAHCRRATRRANSSFPLAFRLLPPAKRRAMDALYAFLRVTDDIADAPGATPAIIADWRDRLSAALDGKYSHRVHAPLHATVREFGIPPRYLFDVLAGVAADQGPVRMATFAELEPYCYRVASAVGLACVHVWGFRGDVTAAATAAGIAFQLTNILRDLGEDRGRGRVYLPADELDRFGCPPEAWDARSPAFQAMMRFQADRAWDYYRRAEPLHAMLSPDGRAIYRVMAGTYRRLLTEIERAGFDVLSRRVRVPKWRKIMLLMSGWLK